MLQNLTGWHALIILAVIVLIFGAAKLPALAKSVGQSVRILKKEVVDTTAASEPESGTVTPLHAERTGS
jgi:sec-independent protein translocase protein TatA